MYLPVRGIHVFVFKPCYRCHWQGLIVEHKRNCEGAGVARLIAVYYGDCP